LYLEVYPDIIFILNFFLDLILLFLLKKVNRKKSSILRIILSAMVGGIFAAITGTLLYLNVFLRFLFMNILAALLMIRIAFGKLSKEDFLKQVIVLYLITYFVGGLVNSIYYHTNIRMALINFGKGLPFSNISWKFVVRIFLILIPLSIFLLWLLRCYKLRTSLTYDVTLVLQDRSIKTKGLMDTGNCLYDPIYKKPVMVVENSLMEQILSPELIQCLDEAKKYLSDKNYDIGKWDIENEHILRLRFIPFHSLGKTGMMIGIKLDKVLIDTGKETICNEKVTAAIYDNRLSTGDDYQVILHKELIGI